MKYIIGNWKSNNNNSEALVWLEKFSQIYNPTGSTEVILCPTYTHLPALKAVIKEREIPLKLGAQDLSPFKNGAYTGEVCGSQLAEFVQYCLIGHSERRTYLGETDELLAQKVQQAKANNIEPIFCVQSTQTPIPENVSIVAYEPVEAIGSGVADSPDHANDIIGQIKKLHPNVQTGIYGGSVKPDNAESLTSQPNIEGVLPGGASLKPDLFAEIIKNVSKN